MESSNQETSAPPLKRAVSQESLEIFKKARSSNLFCDAILRTEDGGKFPVHKCILVVCSPYFYTLFTSTLNRDKGDFLIPGVNNRMLNGIIEYAYAHRIKLDFASVEDILLAADEFNILQLIQECSDFLMHNLKAENCISTEKLADRFFLPKLQAKSNKYLMRNFVDVSQKSRELMQVSHFELISILNNEELNVKDEETVWETVIRWIDADIENRRKHIADLMKCIRLGLIDTEYFMREVKCHPYVEDNDGCRQLVAETLTFLSDLDSIGERSEEFVTPELALPRIPHEVIFAVGGWSSGSPSGCIETYDSRADRWIRMGDVDPNGPRAYHRSVVINNDIYIIGGFDGSVYFSGCRRFNVVTKQWKDIGPMHCKRCYVSVAVLDDIIYAMGGYDGIHRQNTAEKYDYHTNQWTMISPMQFQRSDASACSLNGCVYIIGGFNGNECLSSVEFYSPPFNQWTMITPMRSGRSGVSCTTYRGQLYVLGGFNGMARLQSVERYNPRNGAWSVVPDMLTRRSNFATEVIDDMLFAIGGYNGERIICQVECYSETSNQWFEATDMNINRSALSACLVRDIPNIRDYIHKERHKLLEEKRQRLIELQRQDRQ